MKKIGHKLSITFVCLILGFLITYQLKSIYSQNYTIDYKETNSELVLEVEELKNQREEYQKRLNELENKIIDYENAAASRISESELLLKDLDKLRILTGTTDINGEGVVVTITPKSNLFGNKFEVQPIGDYDLVAIVNELNAAGAEAISINDIRLTMNTGIRNAGNSILIGKERISFNKEVTIKAVGNRELLEAALSFPGNIPRMLWEFCDVKWKTYENIEVTKSNYEIELKYAVPVEKRGE